MMLCDMLALKHCKLRLYGEQERKPPTTLAATPLTKSEEKDETSQPSSNAFSQSLYQGKGNQWKQIDGLQPKRSDVTGYLLQLQGPALWK